MSARWLTIVGHALWGAVVYGIVLAILFSLMIGVLNPVVLHANWDLGSLFIQSVEALLVGAIAGALIRGMRAYYRSCAKETGPGSIPG